MKINYKKYVAYPATLNYLHKVYTQDILNKWGDQLAFLYQNGFSLENNSYSDVEEQMMLYNNFQTYDDLDDLIKSYGKAFFDEPTPIGYKIVDSVLNKILTDNAWALTNFVDIKKMGELYKNQIIKSANLLQMVFDSDDIEIERVMNEVLDGETDDLLDECISLIDNETFNILLIKFQELYKRLFEIHKRINRALLNTSEKGRLATIGNTNDELYGSAGGYNPTTSEIVSRNGSAVYLLKTLCDSNIPDEDLRYKLLVLAKECIEDGETDKILNSFAANKFDDLKIVRKIIADVTFSGIMILLDLKHNLTLIENDTLNKTKSELILKELADICKYTNYNSKQF